MENRTSLTEPVRNFCIRKGRAEISALHPIEDVSNPTRLIEKFMIGSERSAERAAGVPGRRLNPKRIDNPIAQDLSVGNTIESDAAGQAQLALPCFCSQAANHPHNRLLGHRLDRGSEVH